MSYREQYYRVNLSILENGKKEPFIIWEKFKNNYVTHYALIKGRWTRICLEHERYDMVPISEEEAERYEVLWEMG